jgi:type I restriction enzyme S subunit
VEQIGVANTLDAIEARIDLLRQSNTTLEAIAQALFKSWFVDFDPVHAKAEGREPEVMGAATAALFPSEFEESELGLIPKGWRAVVLRETLEINPRYTLRKGTLAPYLDMASVPTSGHVPTSPVEREFSSGTKFKNGDTLLARITPCLENGKTAHVDSLEADQIGWGSTEFIVLRPRSPLTPYFAYLLARQPEFRAFAIQSMTGTSGRQRIELGQLERFHLTIPDDRVAAAFGSFIEPMRNVIAANAERMVALAQLRDTLLPRLISGKLRLPKS